MATVMVTKVAMETKAGTRAAATENMAVVMADKVKVCLVIRMGWILVIILYCILILRQLKLLRIFM